jgi:hypothetical protein
MAVGIDWKRSLIMTAILIGILYALDYFIDDEGLYCMAAIVIFVIILIAGNLVGRNR